MDVTYGDVTVWVSPLVMIAMAGFWATVQVARKVWA